MLYFDRNDVSESLKDVDIEKVLASNKISFGKKTIKTLLVTFVMIISH